MSECNPSQMLEVHLEVRMRHHPKNRSILLNSSLHHMIKFQCVVGICMLSTIQFFKFEQYQHQRIYFDHQHRYLVSSVPRYVLDIQYSLIYSNTLYYILIQILLLSKKDRTGSRWKSLSRGPGPIDPAAHTICQAKGGEGPRGLAGRFEGIPRRDCGI